VSELTQRVLRAHADYIDHIKQHVFGESEKREQLDNARLEAWRAWDVGGRPDLADPVPPVTPFYGPDHKEKEACRCAACMYVLDSLRGT
jgi:hypothetical protein